MGEVNEKTKKINWKICFPEKSHVIENLLFLYVFAIRNTEWIKSIRFKWPTKKNTWISLFEREREREFEINNCFPVFIFNILYIEYSTRVHIIQAVSVIWVKKQSESIEKRRKNRNILSKNDFFKLCNLNLCHCVCSNFH